MADFGPTQMVDVVAAPIRSVDDDQRHLAAAALVGAAVRADAPVSDLRMVLDVAGLSLMAPGLYATVACDRCDTAVPLPTQPAIDDPPRDWTLPREAADRRVRRCSCGGWIFASHRRCHWCGVDLSRGSAASGASSRPDDGRRGSEPSTPNQGPGGRRG